MTIGTAMGVTEGRAPYERGGDGDTSFRAFTALVQASFEEAYEEGGDRLFTVDTGGLWETYLEAIEDPAERQGLNCHCCRDFVRHYGGLVTLSEDGTMRSAVWSEDALPGSLPARYHQLTAALRRAVERRPVASEFLWKSGRWGTVEAGGFRHLHLNMPQGRAVLTLTEGQEMAERQQDHIHLSQALVRMKPEHVRRAVGMLEAGGLIRPESLLPMGRFLAELQARVNGVHGERRSRMIWYAVAHAARGWCSPRGSAFGALVEDVAEGLSVEAITRRHNERLDPLHYQRPQAAPPAGNIAQAEKLIETLGLAPALRRRPMALEEVPATELLWRLRRTVERAPGGVFGHLKPKGAAAEPSGPLNTKPTVVTFVKFRREVLPRAMGMRAVLPYGIGNFCALTTAVVPEAPPLLRWDAMDRRNPGAWYVYGHGSNASVWGLVPGERVEVLAVTLLPPDWYGATECAHTTHGRALFVLRGAGEDGLQSGLFPECLRSELHGVRATIEAHSRATPLEGELRQRASGWLIGSGPVDIEVTTESGRALYRIDRVE